MKPLKSKVSITLDNDIINKIKELSEEDDRSFSQYINMVLPDRFHHTCRVFLAFPSRGRLFIPMLQTRQSNIQYSPYCARRRTGRTARPFRGYTPAFLHPDRAACDSRARSRPC